ncbi:hypothetical protein B0H17DRAFT_1028042 [Mycena rosella]|uniref:F-box domain-containing protein n=1 Tax=Mycena rosella TaxID=1033263 RepID=A0AAD7H0H0_MYCRO|nr:hypothetical protein B0H17DRAFT_1028042 [Mycena rosella]
MLSIHNPRRAWILPRARAIPCWARNIFSVFSICFPWSSWARFSGSSSHPFERARPKFKPIENPNAALTLSQVCRYWRQVAHGTPRLWAEFSVVILDFPCDAAGIRAWLDQSARCPLSLALTSESSGAEPPDSTVINELLLEKSRLTSLEILTPDSYLPLAPLFTESLDALHTLRITDECAGSFESLMGISGAKVDLAAFAPHLRNDMFSPDIDWNNFFTNIPWSQLSHLTFVTPIRDSFDILRQCHDLQRLEIGTDQWDYEDPDVPVESIRPLVTLPNLSHLGFTLEFLGVVEIGVISPFFQRLAFPALTSLRIQVDSCLTTLWYPKEFASFQVRAPNIRHLELSYVHLTSEELMNPTPSLPRTQNPNTELLHEVHRRPFPPSAPVPRVRCRAASPFFRGVVVEPPSARILPIPGIRSRGHDPIKVAAA